MNFKRELPLLIALTIALLTDITKQADNLQYLKLEMYITHDCKYCRFVSEQLHTLIKDNAWEVILEYEEIDCNRQIQRCRDDLSKPLMFMWEINNEGKQVRKLGELGGTRSKIEIKDWVEGYFSIYAPKIQLQSIDNLMQKYEVQRVSNAQEAIKMYKAFEEMQKIKQSNRFNILDRLNRQKNGQNLHQLNDQDGNSHHRNSTFLSGQQIKYILILGLIVIGVMFFVNKSSQKKSVSVRIPSEDMD